ncbi:hypothetical protein CCHR01_15240 [Colletotrichum chrysophilum]|uniref:Uncharacterized protein n=1 Tax=Colletotrichum chrysophilum TaxID=1836956 RepID=A0AAD9A618_9PEZI|nr:hypothetical protein CCHR01_15240 [Colletotrichum chrysophilum]
MTAGGGKAFGNKGRWDKKQRPPTTTLAGQAFSACSGVMELGRANFEFSVLLFYYLFKVVHWLLLE